MKQAAIVALFATGCSWMFSRPPNRSAPSCAPSYAAPALDTYQAIGGGVLALWAFGHASDDQYSSEADTFGLIGAVLAAETTLYALSARYGFEQARACRELRVERAGEPQWIAPSMPAEAPMPPIEVEQHVDVDDNQIDVHTTIRPARPSPQ